MIQRKCGTCRYFEESGIAASGWCKHPDRQDLQHMVLVRKTELACRNGWDDDLWEPAEAKDVDSSTPSALKSTWIRYESDEPGEPWNEKGSNPASGVGDRSHNSVREQVGPVPERHTGRNGVSHGEQDERSYEVAWSSSFQPSPAWNDIDASDEVQQETFSTRGLRQTARRRDSRDGERAPGESALETMAPPSFERLNAGEPASANGAEPHGTFGVIQGASSRDEPSTDRPSGPVQQSGVTEQFQLEPDEIRAEGQDAAVATDVAEPGRDDRGNDFAVVDPDESSIVRVISLNVPESVRANATCRNCRDFIPEKKGRGGWCSNPFAFEQRQHVEGDSLACQSTYGNWWSPADDWWMERADITHHSAPTPYVNAMIRESCEPETGDDGSTQRRERS